MEHMDGVLPNTLGYNFYGANAHTEAITVGFTAHLGRFYFQAVMGFSSLYNGSHANGEKVACGCISCG